MSLYGGVYDRIKSEAPGAGERDVETLGFFAFVRLRRQDGSPKPALALWDSFRK